MEWSQVMLLLGVLAMGRAACVEADTPETGHLSQAFPDVLEEEEPDIKFPDSSSSQEGESNLGDINWNETVDYLLSITNNNTLSKGRDEVPIRDVLEQFTRKVGPLTLRGEFTANQGRLTGLSSVRRKGEVRVAKQGTTFTMTCPVGLDNVRIRYDHYRIKIHRGPSVSGSLEGEIGSNTVQVTASIDVTEEACTTRLDEVKITELTGLKVRVLGLTPPLDDLMSRITTWLTDVFKDVIQRNLERYLTRELTKGLEKSKCEKYASYFIFVNPK